MTVEYRRNLKVIGTSNFRINGIQFNSNGTRILETEDELKALKKVKNSVFEFKLADGTVVNPAPKLEKKEKEKKYTSKKLTGKK